MAISKIPSAGFQDNVKFRNIIINGDMSIAQRGTSATGITSNGSYTIDRIITGIATAGTWTQSQSTDVPTAQGFSNSLKMDCTTANASLSAGSALLLHHRIEGQNVQYLKYGTSSAESITLSFWVKSNKTGTYIIELDQDGNGRDYSQSYTINSANTWEKKTLTFNGDTSATLANDNTQQLEVNFWLSAGTDWSSGTLNNAWSSTVNANRAVGQVNLADSTANEWYITGVQLEAGQTASEFEFLPYDVNLQRCLRYYERYQGTGANRTTFSIGIKRDTYNGTDASVSGILNYKVRKRGSVTITYNASNNYSYSYGVTGAQFFSSYSFSNIRPDFAVFNGELGTGVTNSGGIIHMREETSKFTAIDSEL